MQVSEFLPFGAERAATAKALCEALHLTKDELRKRIKAERRNGAPICSRTATSATGKAGYFLPTSPEEIKATIRQLKSREKEIRTTRKAIETAYRALCDAESV